MHLLGGGTSEGIVLFGISPEIELLEYACCFSSVVTHVTMVIMSISITPQLLFGEDRCCLSDRARLPPYVFQ